MPRINVEGYHINQLFLRLRRNENQSIQLRKDLDVARDAVHSLIQVETRQAREITTIFEKIKNLSLEIHYIQNYGAEVTQ